MTDDEPPRQHGKMVWETPSISDAVERVLELLRIMRNKVPPPQSSVAALVSEAAVMLYGGDGSHDLLLEEADRDFIMAARRVASLNSQPGLGSGFVRQDAAFMMGFAMAALQAYVAERVEGEHTAALREHLNRIGSGNELRKLNTAKTKGWWHSHAEVIAAQIRKGRGSLDGMALGRAVADRLLDVEPPAGAREMKRPHPSPLAVKRFLATRA